MSCSNGGWSGSLQVKGAQVPFLNADIAIKKEIQTSNPLTNISDRSERNHSISKQYVEGNCTFEIFDSSTSYAAAFSTILDLAMLKNPCNGLGGGNGISFTPNNTNGITVPGTNGKGFITSLTVSCSATQIATCSFSFLATNSSAGGPSGAGAFVLGSVGPLPWYSISYSMNGSGDDTNISNFLTEFSITITNDTSWVNAFNCQVDASDIRIGKMKVTGSGKYLLTNNGFASKLLDGASLTAVIGPRTLHLPYLVFGSDNFVNQGNNVAPQNPFSFTSFGNGSNPSIY